MSSVDWLSQPMCQWLTVTLMHFVWQGLAICLVLIFLVELCKVRRATARYACSLVALVAMTICPPATLSWLALHHEAETIRGRVPFEISPAQIAWGLSPGLYRLEAVQPYALGLWLLGVMFFGSRLFMGVLVVVQLRRSCLPLPPKLTTIVAQLGKRLQIEALPIVFLSRQAAEAMAVGLVRPLVLIPAAWATEMPLQMLEAIIAHELAHLRRRDLW